MKTISRTPLAAFFALTLAPFVGFVRNGSQQAFTDEQMIEASDAAGRAARGGDVEKTLPLPPGHAVALTWKKYQRERIIGLKLVSGKFTVEWVSPVLDEYFGVTTADDFTPVHTKDFDAVTFNGCIMHMCDSTKGILLYVPGQHQIFEVKVSGKDATYSPNLSNPANKRYKDWLEKEAPSFDR